MRGETGLVTHVKIHKLFKDQVGITPTNTSNPLYRGVWPPTSGGLIHPSANKRPNTQAKRRNAAGDVPKRGWGSGDKTSPS